MKKLLKLLALYQAARHGGGHAAGHRPYKPWKAAKKWKKQQRRYHGHGYGYQHPRDPYGHGPYHHPPRPRGVKGLILEAVLHRLLRR